MPIVTKLVCSYFRHLYNNPFTPMFLNVDMLTVAKWDASQKPMNRMANRVDPDETAPYEPSHLDLRGLQRYMFWSPGLEGLRSENEKQTSS